jgi:hypothetical protein
MLRSLPFYIWKALVDVIGPKVVYGSAIAYVCCSRLLRSYRSSEQILQDLRFSNVIDEIVKHGNYCAARHGAR